MRELIGWFIGAALRISSLSERSESNSATATGVSKSERNLHWNRNSQINLPTIQNWYVSFRAVFFNAINRILFIVNSLLIAN